MSNKGNKFGTFGGVFTPSVLTILGVIMYLRLGWVVGQAGIVFTIGIILIAHVISITTGLSVSSIATDRKVKAGGLYYMLSRSLGLPIGGSIGIALFIGTALSISIYILGFAESFNQAMGFDNLRITGSITLILITSIALISTSFAIKTQYYIMAGIVLSLISIVAGIMFFPLGEYAVTTIDVMKPKAEGIVELAVVFGIFFPAVTGFTAGVAMSGDLKDPKRSIPKGTMASIAVGLIVYLALACLLGFYINGAALREDTDILSKITLLVQAGWSQKPMLLYAGIWGATLSSALGGILGAPRILQAMSIDKITPKLFGKGVGKSNEPRNALLLTFLMAEIGVLGGNLDAIAPIVSMFYLTAYGFINLTSALESWTASDFRPTFKIPKVISILGAVATFTVMSQISLTAMLGSFVLIFMVFLYLSKQQINLGFSNVWQGVWAEIVREGLFRIDKKTRKDDKKNWRPNVLLFSGEKARRSYLVDFGKAMVGKLGLVSSFDLVQTDDAELPLKRAEQSIETGSGFTGMFFRKYQTRNVYEGIQTIAETYGFSGVEPNTVLLGWARYSKSPSDFSKLLGRFRQMDYNTLIMDYDQRYGFGQYETIDIWWEGKERHISFALTMARFLTSHDDWMKAKVRVFIILDKTQVNATEVYQTMENELEELRVYAEVKIVDNDYGRKQFYDAIEVESAKADLIFVELPEITEGEEEKFYTDTNELCKEIGTVVLYQASSHFSPIDIGWKTDIDPQNYIPNIQDQENSMPAQMLVLPQDQQVAPYIVQLQNNLNDLVNKSGKAYLQPIANENALLLESIKTLVKKSVARIEASIENEEELSSEEITQMMHQSFLDAENLIKNYGTKKVKQQANTLYEGMVEINKQVMSLGQSMPKNIFSLFDYPNELSEGKLQNFTGWQRFRAKKLKKPAKFTYQLRKYMIEWFRLNGLELTRDLARKFNADSADFHDEMEKILRRFGSVLQRLEKQSHLQKIDLESVKEEAQKCFELTDDLINADQSRFNSYTWFLNKQLQLAVQNMAYAVDSLNLKQPKGKQFGWKDQLKDMREEIVSTPQIWAENQVLFNNMHRLDLSLQEFQVKLDIVVDKLKSAFHNSLQGNIIYDLKKLNISFQNFIEDHSNELPSIVRSELEDNFQYQQVITEFMSNLDWLVGDLPQEIEVMSEEAIQEPKTIEVTQLDSFSISPLNIINYIVQTHFTEPLVADTDQLNSKVIEANEVLEDIERIMAVSGKSFTEEGKESDKIAFVQLITEESARIKIIYQDLLDMQTTIGKSMDKYLGDTNEKLTTYGLVKEAVNLDSFLRTQTRKQVFSIFTERWENFQEQVQQSFTELRYKKSKSLRGWLNRNPKQLFTISNILELSEKISPKREVMEHLPFYYKQLFVKEQHASMELWHNRAEEMGAATKAVRRHRDGTTGALLVTGEPDSGKSFLSEKIARTYFEDNKVFTILPPEGGDCNLSAFRQAMNRSIGKHNHKLETLFDKLPDNSVMVFHDVELWWENTENGFAIINRLIELIDEYSHKCFMVLNINQFTYKLLHESNKLDESFMEVITCLPMNAQDLRDIILLRHKSSHLKFRLDGTTENKLSNWTLAGLFTKYAKHSNGNVGFALQTWLGNIVGVRKTELDIIKPSAPNVEILEDLPEHWQNILQQFILHKKMMPSKFARLFEMKQAKANHEIKALVRAGLLTDLNGVLEINRYFMPYLIKELDV